jgi:UDP-glucose 4-epimerase
VDMNDCTVLVVGGAGYIGTHMVNELLKAKINVISLDNLSTGHRGLLPGGLFIEGRLGDAKLLEKSSPPIISMPLCTLQPTRW